MPAVPEAETPPLLEALPQYNPPLPSVIMACPAVPPVAGKVRVRFDAWVLDDLIVVVNPLLEL